MSTRRSTHSINQLGMEYASTKETLAVYIQRACDPTLVEPNLNLDLDISEYINLKKANTPREAAVEVLRHVNSRNNHVSMLALTLLDILVKNCGYAFHLQISTKEFLNELVRRFPERPPMFPPPPMTKILELIHEWKSTLCVHSKHKEDLVHIRDMHRLLGYKGYRFPNIDKRSALVLNPQESLMSPDELEEADRADQSAKLQELIRRGTPKDLAAAQELMKVMAGAEPDKQPNYEKQVEKELDKVQQRVLLLNEMLNNAKPNERLVDGDAYDQIATKCKHAQPKIQRWIEESYDQSSSTSEKAALSTDRLLMINDLINSVLGRYSSFQKGDRAATADIPKDLPTSSQKKPTQQAISLIDFDDEPVPSPTSPAPALDPLADLAGLSLSSAPSIQPQTTTRSAASASASLLDFDTIAPVQNKAAPRSGPSTPNYAISLSTPSIPSSTSNGASLDDLLNPRPAASKPLQVASSTSASKQPTKADPFADLLDL